MRNRRERRPRRSLPGLIKDFKSVTTRIYKRMIGVSDDTSLWQILSYDELPQKESYF